MSQPANEDTPRPKTMHPNRLRQNMYSLILDWIHLKTMQPTLPAQRLQDVSRSSNVKDYGHPQEWASDTAADITQKLVGWHDTLAEHLTETLQSPQRKPQSGSEETRILAAWKYLEPRCEQLTQLIDAEALKELPDLHNHIRRTIGLSVPKYTLPIPCPNDQCGLRTLIRVLGIGQDFITCDTCGYTIKAAHYPLLIRMTLDTFIATQEQTARSPMCTGTVGTAPQIS